MIVKQHGVTPFDFEGLAIRDYTAGLDTTASFAVITVPPGAVHPQAWSRRSDKYYYVIDGTIELTVAGEAHALSAGDFCLVTRGARFSYRNTCGMPATLGLVHVPGFDAGSEVFV